MVLVPDIPNHCGGCGKAFPWKDKSATRDSRTASAPAEVSDKNAGHVMYNITAAGNINVGGDLVVAREIRDSFNKVRSSTPPAVADLLGKLADALTEATKQMPPEPAESASQDYDTLTREMAKKEPRKTVLKSVGEGLMETVKVAGQLANPVVNIVSAILKASS